MTLSVCARCGIQLVPATLVHEPTAEPTAVVAAEQNRNVEFVELCRPWSFPVAMLIKQTLEQNHVATMIQGMHSLSVMPHLAFGGQLRVLVGREQLEYARALYQAYFESDEDIDYITEE